MQNFYINVCLCAKSIPCAYCYVFAAENGQKSVSPLLVAPVDVRNVHVAEYLTQHCCSPPLTDQSLFSLTCQIPKTTNIQGTVTTIISYFSALTLLFGT